MSLNIQLVTRPSTVVTFEGAVKYAFGQVTYGKVQPNDEFPIPFGTYNVNVTEPLDPPFRQLYSHGCRQSDGSNNCTASCLSPNVTFSDMYTLSNCVAYPKISEFLAGNNVTDDAEAIAKQFGIIGDLTTQRLVYDTTYSCLSSLCDTTIVPGATCEVQSVCANVPVLVSSNVGGIGGSSVPA